MHYISFYFISIFPAIFDNFFSFGLLRKAIDNSLISYSVINPRDFCDDNKYRSIDDRPFGGGSGMVMSYSPLERSLNFVTTKLEKKTKKIIYLSPQGKKFNHEIAYESRNVSSLVFICGRYEGVDQRFINDYVDEEWSIGDYILNGGELASLVVCEAISRFIPGFLGNEESYKNDSFINGVLDYPVYTRPRKIKEQEVPEVLINGDHKAIEKWRRNISLLKTWQNRPDLICQNKFLFVKLMEAFDYYDSLNKKDKIICGLKVNLQKPNII